MYFSLFLNVSLMQVCECSAKVHLNTPSGMGQVWSGL